MLSKPQTEAHSRESLAAIIRMVLETKLTTKTLKNFSKYTTNDICVFAGRFLKNNKCLQKSLWRFFIMRYGACLYCSGSFLLSSRLVLNISEIVILGVDSGF